MRVLMIGALVIISMCIFIGVLIYDRRVKNDKNKLLTSLWNRALDITEIESSVVHETVVGVEVPKLKILNDCGFNPADFGIALRKLVDDDVVINKPETVEFTAYGATYYDFTVLPKLVQK